MDVEFLVIGAGAVGLAIAAELSCRGEVLVLEREGGIGRGISSRNSEVVHSGLYYEPGSLKARLCVEGRRHIEAWAAQGAFNYSQVGKFIVATEASEIPELEALVRRGERNGVEGLRMASLEELREAEPAVRAMAALWSPATGIVDSHGMMRHLWSLAERRGATIALHSKVCALKAVDDGWELTVEEQVAEGAAAENAAAERAAKEAVEHGAECRVAEFSDAACLPDLAEPEPARAVRHTLSARVVVNAAGLHADRIAALAGVPVEELGLRQYWSRGEYFAPRPGACAPLRHLVYPVPPHQGEGHLGIHATVDLAGGLRFGPSAHWPNPVASRHESFAQDPALAECFAQALRRYLPEISAQDLQPAGVGLRPRLRPARDFQIRLQSGPGKQALLNLIGIESPGLTSAPAIAGLVGGLLAG